MELGKIHIINQNLKLNDIIKGIMDFPWKSVDTYLEVSLDTLDIIPDKLEVDLIYQLEPTFKYIIKHSTDLRRKGGITCEQKKRIRTFLLEKERSEKWFRKQSTKRFR